MTTMMTTMMTTTTTSQSPGETRGFNDEDDDDDDDDDDYDDESEPKERGGIVQESIEKSSPDHFLPLLFPKDSESQKILDIRLWEMGAKRPLNGTSKVKKVREKKTFFCAAIIDNFQTKMFISETTSFHYFSPRIPNL